MPGPLDGIRVLDLSWIIAGPLVSRLMADYGAEVIKVESRKRMDIGRANRTPLYGELPGDANSNPDTGGYFQDVNAGKLSCTIDLGSEEGRGLLRQLVAVSDVTICNLAGDQYDRWGIGYETARDLNPGIIMVNLPSMESRGPRAGWRGFGDMFTGMAGLKAVSGRPEDPPLPWGHQYADFASNPFHATIAVMAALLHRDRTGEGQFIEVGQYESTAALLGPAALEYGLLGHSPRPVGNRDGRAVPHNLYPCAGDDAWCAIAVENDEQWRALVAYAGVDALADPAFATTAGRRTHEAEIDALLDEWTRDHDSHVLAEALQERGVPAGPFQNTPDLVERDPVLGERYFHPLEHPAGRTFLVHGPPAVMRQHPVDVRLGPLIGEHTFDVMTRVLGLDPDEVAELAARGVLE